MLKVIEEKIAVPLIIILTLLVLGGIYYSVRLADKDFEKATEYAPIKTEKKDPTATWQTYRNEEFGFEVKYPEEYSIKELKEAENPPFPSRNSIFIGAHTEEENPFLKNIFIYQYEPGDFIESAGLREPSGMDPLSSSDLAIGGFVAKKYDDTVYVVVAKRHRYEIGISAQADASLKEHLPKILSTFKFIE